MKKVMKKNTKPEFDKNVHYSPVEMERYLAALCETHDEKLSAINENFIVINRKLDSHSEMIGSLMENMEIVKGDISVIKGDLKKKVDYDDFLSLVRRVQKIEAKI